MVRCPTTRILLLPPVLIPGITAVGAWPEAAPAADASRARVRMASLCTGPRETRERKMAVWTQRRQTVLALDTGAGWGGPLAFDQRSERAQGTARQVPETVKDPGRQRTGPFFVLRREFRGSPARGHQTATHDATIGQYGKPALRRTSKTQQGVRVCAPKGP